MNLSCLDLVVIALYAVGVGGVVLWHTHWKSDTAEFLLAGRKLTLPLFVGTLVATWYGGILGIAELTGSFGLGTWLIQGIVWYVAYLAFALLLAARIRRMEFYTVTDILAARFGNKVAFLGGLFTYLMTNPAPYILSLGVVVQIFTGVSLAKAIVVSAVFTALYTAISGFRGVVYTDVFQCLLMYVAFGLLVAVAWGKWGGMEFLRAHLSAVEGYRHHLSLTGGMSLGYILVWGGMACWIFVDPNFYQRCFAARTPETARRGVLLAIVCWVIFDLLCCGSALYAFAAQNAGKLSFSNWQMAHIALADFILPSPLKGFFVAGVVSAIMSTADSFMFAGAMTISRDYYWRFLNPKATPVQMVWATRLAVIATATLAAFLAIALPSVKDLWYTLGTVGLSALLIPALCSFQPRLCRARAAMAGMIAGAGVSSFWLLWAKSLGIPYPLSLEPLYPGLMACLGCYLAFWRKP